MKMNDTGWHFYQPGRMIHKNACYQIGGKGEITATATITTELHVQNPGISSLTNSLHREYRSKPQTLGFGRKEIH